MLPKKSGWEAHGKLAVLLRLSARDRKRCAMPSRGPQRRPIPRLALSRSEVSVAVGVSVGSVDLMVAEGALPQPRVWHKRKLWLVSEVEAALYDWPIFGADIDQEPVRRTSSATTKTMRTDPLGEHYRRIGYDPDTMGKDDYRRLMEVADQKWRDEVVRSPPNKRESSALEHLRAYSTGTLISPNGIKGMGLDTADRLEARGFIKVVWDGPAKARLTGYRVLRSH